MDICEGNTVFSSASEARFALGEGSGFREDLRARVLFALVQRRAGVECWGEVGDTKGRPDRGKEGSELVQRRLPNALLCMLLGCRRRLGHRGRRVVVSMLEDRSPEHGICHATPTVVLIFQSLAKSA